MASSCRQPHSNSGTLPRSMGLLQGFLFLFNSYYFFIIIIFNDLRRNMIHMEGGTGCGESFFRHRSSCGQSDVVVLGVERNAEIFNICRGNWQTIIPQNVDVGKLWLSHMSAEDVEFEGVTSLCRFTGSSYAPSAELDQWMTCWKNFLSTKSSMFGWDTKLSFDTFAAFVGNLYNQRKLRGWTFGDCGNGDEKIPVSHPHAG